MPGFRENSQGVATGWLMWVGDPDDEAAHRGLLASLQESLHHFLGIDETPSNSIRGNLGEFIAYHVGRHHAHPQCVEAHAANAWDPLSRISRPDIDIVWANFGESPDDDWVALQEVKTTVTNSLSIADNLIEDYDKLFGEDPRLTLRTRLGGLKNRLDQQGRSDLAPRLSEIGGPPIPGQARGVRLIPTVIHDGALDSSTKMAAVRQALIGKGWLPRVIRCWSVQMDNINQRLTRLSRGQ